MSSTAIVTMIGVCGLVWGGFLTLLVRAVRHEGRKASEEPTANNSH